MTTRVTTRWKKSHGVRTRLFVALAMVALCAAAVFAQQPASSSIVLDRVVAVVNRRVLLASDLDDEMRLSILEPSNNSSQALTPTQALAKLVSRTLVEEQMRQEDMSSIEPAQKEVESRLHELRTDLPACVRAHCSNAAGWSAFLAAQGLTEQRVEAYLRSRMEILRFIEQRFRQGIQIEPQQVEQYYRKTMLPQYAPGETVPPLDEVAARIREILLEQQVNDLFDNWLANLRQQGNVEILDPSLATGPVPAPQAAAGPDRMQGGVR